MLYRSIKNLAAKCSIFCLIYLVACSFPANAVDQEKNMYRLSPQQLAAYEENGLLIISNFFSEEDLQQVSNGADRLQAAAEQLSKQQTGKIMHKGTQFVIERKNDTTQIQRIVWVGSAEPELLKLGRQSKILVPVGQILGSNTADQLINQLHYKLPNDEVKFDWHQDVKNRRTFDPKWQDINKKGSFVQTIIAVDPMTADNGTIYYVPHSHLHGDLFLDKITDRAELARVAELDKATPLLMNPGDIVFMHPYLVHGSEPNTSASPRRVFINGFAYPGANKEPYPGEGSAQSVSLE
jgi:ectoine hydroxylase-related dioxygenase (phytanoyl-CoA dioxygenase family)